MHTHATEDDVIFPSDDQRLLNEQTLCTARNPEHKLKELLACIVFDTRTCAVPQQESGRIGDHVRSVQPVDTHAPGLVHYG